MATRRRMIREFQVRPDELAGMTFSDTSKIGLSDDRTVITLKASTLAAGLPPAFPKDEEGIRFTTPAIGGNLITFYEFAQFHTIKPEDPNQDPATVTDVRGRLHDGTSEYHFTGGAWTVITGGDLITEWNTLKEVSDNLPLFDPDLKLGFVFELSTTDSRFAPSVLGVDVLYKMDVISFHNDWLYTTLQAGLEDTVRPIADVTVPSDGTTTVDFESLVEDLLESEWNIEGIDAVFNETTDPAHRTDLFSSFDTGSRIITLTSAPALNDELLVRFTYRPAVAVDTDDDYLEIGASPAIEFDEVLWLDLGEASSSSNIVNVFSDPPLGVILPAPRREHMVVTLRITSPGSVNLRRLGESVTKYLQERRTIASPSDGRRARIRITEFLNAPPLPDQTGLRSATMAFRLEDVYVFLRDAIETTGVKTLEITTNTGPATVTTSVGG